jgi:hypothetical protein
VAVVALAVRAEDLVRVQARARRYAHDAGRRRVALGGERAGNVRAMTLVVHRIGVVVEEVPAAGVHAVQVGMRVVDAGVYDTDLDALTGIAGRMDRAGTDMLHTPGSFELGIAGGRRVVERPHRMIDLDRSDGGICAQPSERAARDRRGNGIDQAELARRAAAIGADLAKDSVDGRARLEVAPAWRGAAHVDDHADHLSRVDPTRSANGDGRAKQPGTYEAGCQ